MNLNKAYSKNFKKISLLLSIFILFNLCSAAFAENSSLETKSKVPAVSSNAQTKTTTNELGKNVADASVGSNTTSHVNSGTLFQDVNRGFWAEKHITKLALQNILLGNNGKFRPNDSVTQQEAITMAIRFMGFEDEVKKISTVSFPANFKVGNYFKSYVHVAMQKGLLDKNQETSSLSGKESWGEKKATREWVAKLLVRSLGKEQEAQSMMEKATTFADNNKISPTMLGYINAAVSMNLTTGLQNNQFSPKGNVTRAQLATFFSRGQQHNTLTYENTMQGILIELTDQGLRLYGEDGKTYPYSSATSTSYFTVDSEKAISIKDVPLYTKVSVISRAGKAGYVEVIDTKQQVEITTGKLLKKHTNAQKISVDVQDDIQQFNVEDNVAIFDNKGKTITYADIPEQSVLELKRETLTKEKKLIVIQVKSGVMNTSGQGLLTAIDEVSKSVTIKGTDSESTQWNVAKDALIRYQDQILTGGLTELKINDSIAYVVKDGLIISIEVKQTNDRIVKGTLYSVGETSISYVRDLNSRKLEAKVLDSNVTVSIEGIKDANLKDLIADEKQGDLVEITLNAKDQVTHIQVLNRKLDKMTEAVVASYSSKLKILTVIDTKNKPHTFYLSDETKFDFGYQASLENMDKWLTEKSRVNITHVGNQVILLQRLYRYEGVLEKIDLNKNIIHIKMINDKKMEIPFDPSISVFVYGQKNPTLSDIKVGQKVAVALRSEQDKASSISAVSSVNFEVYNVNVKDKRIQLKTNDGTIATYEVNGVSMYNDKNDLIAIEDFKVGQVVNAEMVGSVPKSIRIASVLQGRITNKDTDKKTITLRGYDGSLTTIRLTAYDIVVRGNDSNMTSANFQVGDHVEIIRDEINGNNLNILTTKRQSFWLYNAKNNQIQVKRSLGESDYIFNLAKDVLVYKGDTALTLTSLQENDSIVLVMNKDKVVAIEKL